MPTKSRKKHLQKLNFFLLHCCPEMPKRPKQKNSCPKMWGITLTSSLCRLALVWPKILISLLETHVYTHNFTVFSTYARKCNIFNLIDIGSIMESGENSFFIISAMPAIA